MQFWIRSGGIRSSKTFCTGVALVVVTLFSWSAPLAGDRYSTTAIAASVDENGITEFNLRQTSQPRWIEIDRQSNGYVHGKVKNLFIHTAFLEGSDRLPHP